MSKSRRYENLYKMNTVLSSTQGYRTNLKIIGIDKVIGTREAMDVENTTIQRNGFKENERIQKYDCLNSIREYNLNLS